MNPLNGAREHSRILRQRGNKLPQRCILKELFPCTLNCIYRKNDFAEVSKNLVDTDLKIILNHQNIYVGCSNWRLECYNFLQHCRQCLNILHNYFNDPTKLFSVSNKIF